LAPIAARLVAERLPPNKPLQRPSNSGSQIDPLCRLAAYWVGSVGSGQRCCWPLNADPLVRRTERAFPMDVLVVPHDPKWSRKFEAEAKVIGAALGAAATAIHHIGSTAIPGIFAKPIIDMLVEATSVEAVDERAPLLEAMGYEVKGEFGIPGRRYFRKDNEAGIREYQIHAFAADSGEVARHLAFRDYLRSHPQAAGEYSQLKRELAKQHPSDAGAYMEGKDPFIKATVPAALAWWRSAQQSGGADGPNAGRSSPTLGVFDAEADEGRHG
jgi:GrpB-like predicted nucleotidyltransferase (UPF0157 family)